jgi:hypothetical protein
MVDLAVVIDLADRVTKLKMFPVFDAAHAALACLAVRDDLGKGEFSMTVLILSRSKNVKRK